MYRGGHIGLNALLYAPFLPLVSRSWSVELAVIGAVFTVGLANLPDIDQPLPWIRHRGPTHTIWFAILIGLLTGVGTAFFVDLNLSFYFGFVVGTCSILAHLAGDIVTPIGISPFAPLSRIHVTLDWFKSKNVRVNRILLLLGSIALITSLTMTIRVSPSFIPVG